MTWALAAGTATAATTTTQTPGYPTTVAGGALLLFPWKKPGSANVGTPPSTIEGAIPPASWTLQASLTGSNDGDTAGHGSTVGADVGNPNAWVYRRNADATGSESGTASVVFPNSSIQGAIMACVSSDVGIDTLAFATGKQTSDPGATLALSATSDPGIQAGDIVFAFFAACGDNAAFASPTITCAGVTFGATSFLTGTPLATTQGEDGEYFVAYAIATAGSSSGNPALGAAVTGTTNSARGPCVFVRLRETAGGSDGDPVPVDETDEALALEGSKAGDPVLVDATDEALSLTGGKAGGVSSVDETDEALALEGAKSGAPITTDETDEALALEGAKAGALTPVDETDEALALEGSKAGDPVPVDETDEALELSGTSGAGGAPTPVDETDEALALEGAKSGSVVAVDETDEALALEALPQYTMAPLERRFRVEFEQHAFRVAADERRIRV